MPDYAEILIIILSYAYEALKVVFVILGIRCFIKYLRSEKKY